MIDTHSHLYDEAFDQERSQTIARDKLAGVEAVFLPAIDSGTHEAMWKLCRENPGYCYPLVGLHPTSVNENPDFRKELDIIERLLENPPVERFYGIGEVGLDLYWSKEWLDMQVEALERQIELSQHYGLPLVIHTRDAWEQMHIVLGRHSEKGLKGVMHAFSGSYEDYMRVKQCGDFVFGIGGVVTYKKGGVAEVLTRMSMDDIVLESDAPYLTPVPMRGKRNESAMMSYTCAKISEITGLSQKDIAERTTNNAKRIFSI